MKYHSSDIKGKTKSDLALTIPQMAPFPSGKTYSIIVVDPPWLFTLRENDKSHRGRTPYPNMTDSDILSLPVGSIAAPKSYLFLWVTNTHLPLGLECLTAWGFQYKTIHTWVKSTLDGSRPRIGVGHYGRNCTEQVLVGSRGNYSNDNGDTEPVLVGSRWEFPNNQDDTEHILIGTNGKPTSFSHLGVRDAPNVIFSPRKDHSRKPEIFYNLVDRVYTKLGGNAIELFARSSQLGWDVWGLEAPQQEED